MCEMHYQHVDSEHFLDGINLTCDLIKLVIKMQL